MEVDIKNKGIDYVLREKDADPVDDGEEDFFSFDDDDAFTETNGCRIEVTFYDKMLPSLMNNTIRDLERWVKWMPIEIELNGKLISKDPDKAKWDQITDEAYVKLTKTGALSVYNLGVHVMEMPGYKLGCGGEVVSRKQLKVNFARNDIQHDCPVWKVVRKAVDQRATKENTRRKSLDDAGRQRLADQIAQGEEVEKMRELRLFTAVTRRHYSFKQIAEMYGYRAITNAPMGSRLGDSLMKQKIAFVIADEVIERFGCETLPEMIELVLEKFPFSKLPQASLWNNFVPFRELTKGMSETHVVKNDDDLKPLDTVVLQMLREVCEETIYVDGKKVFNSYGTGGRRIVIGTSETANGWTDASTFVAVSEEFLSMWNLNVRGLTAIHDQEFYEKFHDTCRDRLGYFVDQCIVKLPGIMDKHKRKLNKRQMRERDNIHRIENSDLAADSRQA
jgi:hypothetical protein